MMAIKVQCSCGQKYAFDIEPIDGRMPSTVACPSCGVDGTSYANSVITQNLSGQPAQLATAGSSLRLANSQPAEMSHAASTQDSIARQRSEVYTGQVNRSQAEHEAKAKVSWGDPPATVITYLMSQGFSHPEASALVKTLFQERAAFVRRNGIRKIIGGACLIGISAIGVITLFSMKFIDTKLVGFMIAVGLYGAYMLMKGTFMVVSPKSEAGDVAEH